MTVSGKFIKISNDEKSAGGVYSAAAIALYAGSLLFSALTVFLGLEGGSNEYIYLSYSVAPALFLLLSVLFFGVVDVSVKETFAPPKNMVWFLIALCLQFGLFSLSEVNNWFIGFIQELTGQEQRSPALPDLTGGGLYLCLFVVALCPAVLEELVFRGFLLGGIRNQFGGVLSVLLCGGLFALYHGSPAQTVYQFICGCAFAWIALISGSILPTMLAHFLNNAAIILLYSVGVEALPLPVLVLSGVLLAGTTGVLIGYTVKRKTDFTGRTEKGGVKSFFAYAFLGIFLFGLSWILSMVG